MKCLCLFAAFVSVAVGQLFPFPAAENQTRSPSLGQTTTTTTTTFSPPLPQVPAPPLSDAEHEAMSLRCQDENGTVPYWLDKTCRSYLSCLGFNLSLQLCQEGNAYSYPQRACLPVSEVNCTEQNREFTAIIRSYLAPHFYQRLPLPTRLPLVPISASAAGATFRDQLLGAGRVGDADARPGQVEGDELEDNFGGDEMVIDLDDLPSILVDSTNAINITLPGDSCLRLGPLVRLLETSMNQALLMLVGCPERGCDVTLFHLIC